MSSKDSWAVVFFVSMVYFLLYDTGNQYLMAGTSGVEVIFRILGPSPCIIICSQYLDMALDSTIFMHL